MIVRMGARVRLICALIIGLLLGGGLAAYAAPYALVPQPMLLADVKVAGTAVNFFRKTPSILYLNFFNGATYTAATRSLDIGGGLQIGPALLPVAVASAATIAAPATGNVFHVTGTVQIATITPPFGGRSGCIAMVFDNATPGATLTSGNIALATTVVQNKLLTMCFDPTTTKWYPSY